MMFPKRRGQIGGQPDRDAKPNYWLAPVFVKPFRVSLLAVENRNLIVHPAHALNLFDEAFQTLFQFRRGDVAEQRNLSVCHSCRNV